jgi:hypothetical protein
MEPLMAEFLEVSRYPNAEYFEELNYPLTECFAAFRCLEDCSVLMAGEDQKARFGWSVRFFFHALFNSSKEMAHICGFRQI